MTRDYSQEIKKLGSKIKRLRLEKKLTQINLAAFCDIDVRTVQMIERGELNMSLKIFFSIADSLHISPEELILNETLENKSGYS